MRQLVLRPRRSLSALAGIAVAGCMVMATAVSAHAATPSPAWAQNDSNGAQSRANLNETTLTPSTVTHAALLRSVTAKTVSPDAYCGATTITEPVLTGGKMFAVVSNEIAAYNAATGARLWHVNPDPGFITLFKALAVTNGLVLVGELDCVSQSDPNGAIAAFNATTGAPVWRTQFVGPLDEMVVSGKYAVESGTSVGSGNITTVVNAATGAVVWQKFYDNCGDGVVVSAGNVVTTHCTFDGTGAVLEADALATGTKVWSRSGSWTVQRGDSDTTTGHHLYATPASGVVDDLNPATGATRFALSGATTVLAVDKTRAYAVCFSGTSSICAYDIASGYQVWRHGYTSVPLGAEAGNVLYLGSGEALNAATGVHLKSLFPSTSAADALVVGDGRVLAVSDGNQKTAKLYGLSGS